ncbi:hypothetical protein KY284_029748 [Solanum tuberosum]|nr:hypothetical protein KY284_029748 [Solanum tuberosum]
MPLEFHHPYLIRCYLSMVANFIGLESWRTCTLCSNVGTPSDEYENGSSIQSRGIGIVCDE